MACLRLLTALTAEIRGHGEPKPLLQSPALGLRMGSTGNPILNLPDPGAMPAPRGPLLPHHMTPAVDSSHLLLAWVRTPLSAEGDASQYPHPRSASLSTLQASLSTFQHWDCLQPPHPKLPEASPPSRVKDLSRCNPPSPFQALSSLWAPGPNCGAVVLSSFGWDKNGGVNP